MLFVVKDLQALRHPLQQAACAYLSRKRTASTTGTIIFRWRCNYPGDGLFLMQFYQPKQPTMTPNKKTGDKGESLAATFLEKKGYKIVERNWRFRHWEVDLIASKGNRLHFIEVKTRTTAKYGMPEESIKRDKMRSLKNAAEEYLYIHTEWKYIQFDVVAIMLHFGAAPEIFLIEDIYF